MATKYASTAFTTQEKTKSTLGGATPYTIDSIATVLAADSDGDVYVLGVVQNNDRPSVINVETTAITSGTDWDLGLYLINNDGTIGSVVKKDLLMDGQTMATASNALNGFTAPTIANRGKTLRELLVAASVTTNLDAPQYYLALTANTVGSADGTIRVIYSALKDA